MKFSEQEKKLLQDRFSPSVWNTFSYEQKQEIQKMCKRAMPKAFSRHFVSFRHSFWFFRQWYLVLLIGKDTRKKKRGEDKPPLKKFVYTLSLIFFYLIITLGLLAFLLLCLYLLKCSLGIDILPDKHLQDLLL